MNETKSIFVSRTALMAVFGFIGVVMHWFGIEFPETEQAAFADQILGAVPYIMEAVGFIGVLWGRLTATTEVTITGAPK